MRRGAAWTVERHQAAACRCRGYGHAGSLAIAEPTLVAKLQTPAPQVGARRVPAGRLVVVAIEDVRTLPCRSSVPCPRCSRFRRGVPGAVDGVRPDPTGAGGVRKPVRSWRPWWTPDTTRGHRRDQACGGSGIEHGCRCHDGRVPMLVAAGLVEGSMRIAVLALTGQDVQAAWLPWPAGQTRGRTLGAEASAA